MRAKTFTWIAVLLAYGICFAAAVTSSPYTGAGWNTGAPNDEALVGDTYQELQDLRKGVELRINKEHEKLASSSAGGVHKQGSARAFFQDAAPTTQVDGTAWDSNDTGSLWFDTNSTPDNLAYVLTNSASTGTWTLLSASTTAEIVAAIHTWADVQTFSVQSVHTLGILSNDDITLGAGDDLVGSATSNILINTNKFTVDGATGNTVSDGTLDVAGNIDPTTFENTNGGFLDEDDLSTDSATSVASQQSIKAYVDAITDPAYSGGESHTFEGGLILKHGSITATASTDTTVSFGAAFPTAIISAGVTSDRAASNNPTFVNTLAVGSLKVYNGHNSNVTAYWHAWGH